MELPEVTKDVAAACGYPAVRPFIARSRLWGIGRVGNIHKMHFEPK